AQEALVAAAPLLLEALEFAPREVAPPGLAAVAGPEGHLHWDILASGREADDPGGEPRQHAAAASDRGNAFGDEVAVEGVHHLQRLWQARIGVAEDATVERKMLVRAFARAGDDRLAGEQRLVVIELEIGRARARARARPPILETVADDRLHRHRR